MSTNAVMMSAVSLPSAASLGIVTRLPLRATRLGLKGTRLEEDNGSEAERGYGNSQHGRLVRHATILYLHCRY